MDKIIYISLVQVIIVSVWLYNILKGRQEKYLKYFLVIGLLHVLTKVVANELITDEVILFRSFNPFSFGYLPALYLYTKELYHKRFSLLTTQLLNFTPLIIASIIYVLGVYFHSTSQGETIISSYAIYGYYLLGAQILIYGLLCFGTSIKGMRDGHSASFILKHTLIISSIFLLMASIIFIDVIRPELVDYGMFTYLAYSLFTVIFLLVLRMQLSPRASEITEKVNTIKVERQLQEKYRTSSLSFEEKDEIARNIINLFEEKENYKESSFSLAKLSDEIGVPKHKVSQVLNQELKKTFNQLVNEYRIKAVCSKLLKTDHVNITALAYENGFNSKSSFNTNFKRIMGKTPSEFQNDNTVLDL